MGLLDAMFNGITNAMNFKRNKSLQANAHQMAMEEQRLASQLQMDTWQQQFNMQNEYNSPAAQMQRLKEAGLNPLYTDFGGNVSEMSAAAAAPSASGPSSSVNPTSANPFGGQSLFQDLATFRGDIREQEKQQKNLDNLQTNIDKGLAEIEKLKTEGNLNESKVEEINANIQKLYSEVSRNYSDVRNAWLNTELKYMQFQWQKKVDSLIQNRENTLAESQIRVNQAEIEHWGNQDEIGMLNAQTESERVKSYDRYVNAYRKDVEYKYQLGKKNAEIALKKNNNDYFLELLKESSNPLNSIRSASQMAASADMIKEWLDKGTMYGIQPKVGAVDYFNQTVHKDQLVRLFRQLCDKLYQNTQSTYNFFNNSVLMHTRPFSKHRLDFEDDVQFIP